MSDLAQARDAEVQLLGAAMSGYPELDDLLATVEPDDFYAPDHEAIWAAIGRVHAAGNKPDPVSVRVALGETRIDPLRLVEIVQATTLIANAPHHAETVLEAAGTRKLQTALVRAEQAATAVGLTLAERREEVVQTVIEAARGRDVTRARTLAQAIPDLLDKIQAGATAALSTPWSDLNDAIGGIAPGRLIIVGARPGVGKSLFGTNLAAHVIEHHAHAVLMCSLEMPEDEVTERLLADACSVDLAKIQARNLDEPEWQRVATKAVDLTAMPLTINDDSSLSVVGIRRAARNVQRTRDDLALIVVDYLQLVAAKKRGTRDANRAEEVSDIARGLKLLARETGACVVAMAQINRAGGLRDTGPTMSDIREGGAENDADAVILLHRPDDEIPELRVSVGKNRHGPLAEFPMAIDGHYARLRSVAWSPTGRTA